MFQPRFQITPAMTTALMAIEASRQAVLGLPLDVAMLQSLRSTARLLSTHYSTAIEGNRLTQAQVVEVVAGTRFPGRERDEVEVRHYYEALARVEQLAASTTLRESDAQRLHGLVLHGRDVPTPYRTDQNVITDGQTRRIVYLPPEAKDVPSLMADLFAWLTAQLAARELPVPILAGIAHYQYATIHPYLDGNGRTARLLTTLLLHQNGYGLKGIYALEEYYARRLADYYRALSLGPSHNYYEGRAEADITPFLAYFLAGMDEAFAKVRQQAEQAARSGRADQSPALRQLDPRQRLLLTLFRDQATATTNAIARALGLSPRSIRPLCRKWVEGGFLIIADPSRRNRLYRLAPDFEALATA